MPAIALQPQNPDRAGIADRALPGLLQTPSGLALVEIQGTINSTSVSDDTPAQAALDVGRLVFPYHNPENEGDTSWQKRVYLYVGKHQRLTGEVKKLAKPIAVIRRKTPATSAVPDGDELEIAEIVYYKLLFAHRPEPVGAGG
ncbi:hypothetical protein BAUCODRAFT_34079 [Baudoinia panamericana UAMH 10762]|uniref:Chromosome transmission fidelity protein 8 n=1 Tax=Baudoinia panamericana (strain UAMH 10762) TaxID=717646 RepID=M2MJ41_BAUPA|nr:uncharacterized protein BAUCODRAFT_34079 [Baudoinia panamericana UAMH 10762]EMC96691.1 hypothetical protein BAUCODRAFT_34079 [Baudoinia panamericana UAMH 10762]